MSGSAMLRFNEQGSIENCELCGQAHLFDNREEWERKSRIVYFDMVDDLSWVSSNLSDYATPEEIAAGIRVLEQAWKDKLKDLKEAKQKAGQVLQQQGETTAAHYQRFRGMSLEDQDLWAKWDDIKEARADIKKVLEEIREDEIVSIGSYRLKEFPFLADWYNRFESARDRAIEAWRNRPITEEDWQRELKHREHLIEWEHRFGSAPLGIELNE